jgi:hypothetical protein
MLLYQQEMHAELIKKQLLMQKQTSPLYLLLILLTEVLFALLLQMQQN